MYNKNEWLTNGTVRDHGNRRLGPNTGRLYLSRREHPHHFGSTRRTTRKGAVHKRIMKTYDFSKGKRGPIVKVPEGKEKITIRIDGDIVDWFRHQVDLVQGGSYQTLMNQALREYVDGKSPTLEGTLRRVIREELRSRTA
jgi:uncharacterized protein (DUF4415 family)